MVKAKTFHNIYLPQEYLVPWSISYLFFWREFQNWETWVATFDAEDCGLLGCGGTLEDVAPGLFDGEALDDCPLLCTFMVPLDMCLILLLLGCEGFMTDLSVLGDEMMYMMI